MEKHGFSQSVCHGSTPTRPVTSLFPQTRGRIETTKLRVFTQKAAVSREASDLQRSRPKGSSSQTRSEEKTEKRGASDDLMHDTDSTMRLEGSVGLSLKPSSSRFLPHQICLICLLWWIKEVIHFEARWWKGTTEKWFNSINGFCRFQKMQICPLFSIPPTPSSRRWENSCGES